MFATNITDLRTAAAKFLYSHRNCLVEITFSGVACTYAEDGGALCDIDLRREPSGSADLYIVLRHGDGRRIVQTIRDIRSINVTGRILNVTSDTGIQENVECVALHDAGGREKLLLIRHLAEMAQT
jgi:hypothetical protein